ncbi:5868_t:CDS:1, partial [Entrophospora sp. SA101]
MLEFPINLLTLVQRNSFIARRNDIWEGRQYTFNESSSCQINAEPPPSESVSTGNSD